MKNQLQSIQNNKNKVERTKQIQLTQQYYLMQLMLINLNIIVTQTKDKESLFNNNRDKTTAQNKSKSIKIFETLLTQLDHRSNVKFNACITYQIDRY